MYASSHDSVQASTVATSAARRGQALQCPGHAPQIRQDRFRHQSCDQEGPYHPPEEPPGPVLGSLQNVCKIDRMGLFEDYSRAIPKAKFNEAELRADFPNGAGTINRGRQFEASGKLL